MMKEFFRWFGILTGYPLYLIYFKRKTYYEDRSVQGRFVKGGALIVSNHYHVFDFAVASLLFPFRKLYVVLKSDIYSNRFLAWGMSIFGGIRSDRDTMGMRFIDESIDHLHKGHLVQIFPEAYITQTGEMQDFKTGYIMIAQRADKPIIPVITDGNYGFFRRTHIMIGKPIYLSEYCVSATPDREQILELNRIVWEKCAELKAELLSRVRKEKDKKN